MTAPDRPVYLDCAATTPIDSRVRDVVLRYMDVEFGNAGSRTHIYGQEAARAVRKAREQIAAVVDARPEEVIFTSGATEANNLAILGLQEYGEKTGRKHIISTQVEHKAVLEPLERLASQGFEVELVPPLKEGYVDPGKIARRLRDDTLLVSVMHVNNETGIIQPIKEIGDLLVQSDCVFHVDAAQGFGKDLSPLKSKRIDFISISAHKINGPKGVGGLITRNARNANRAIRPLLFGGGQERGLRPGTQPVFLIAGLGLAAELWQDENSIRMSQIGDIYTRLSEMLNRYRITLNGEPAFHLGNCINFGIPEIDSEALIIALRDIAAISNGSACTSVRYTPSHVITAMANDDELASIACRISWDHNTRDLPITEFEHVISTMAS